MRYIRDWLIAATLTARALHGMPRRCAFAILRLLAIKKQSSFSLARYAGSAATFFYGFTLHEFSFPSNSSILSLSLAISR